MKTASDLVMEAKQSIDEVSVEASADAIANAQLLLDVREPDGYLGGHLAGAINVPRGMLEFRMSAAPEFGPRDLKIVLYCKTSGRAALAAQALKQMGYLNVTSIAGGYDAWVDAGKPVEKPTLPSFD